MKPRHAINDRDICALKTDGKHTKEGWIQIDGSEVTIMNQVVGNKSTGSVTFSRRAFNRLIDWYNKDQKVRRKQP